MKELSQGGRLGGKNLLTEMLYRANIPIACGSRCDALHPMVLQGAHVGNAFMLKFAAFVHLGRQAALPVLRVLSAVLIILGLAGCATIPPPTRVPQAHADVYYGGVYLLAGTVNDIKPRFPALYAETTTATGSAFTDAIRDVIKGEQGKFSKISLRGFLGELAPDDAIIAACGFTGEKYFSESVDLGGENVRNVRNVRAYLGGALLLQNFKRGVIGASDIKLLACYPFSLTCIGLVRPGESVEDAGGRLLLDDKTGLRSDTFRNIVSELAGHVAPVTGLGATLQIRNIGLNTAVAEFIADKFGGSEKEFKQWLAGELGAQLAKQIGVPIIPYVEDTSTRPMAQMMQNAMAYMIQLPAPDFVMDIDLAGFSNVMVKQTATESLWVYGAYAKFTVCEAGSGIVCWQKNLKAGVPKRIAVTQTSIDQSVAKFSALLELLRAVPQDMLADPKARPIIDACLK